MNSEQETAMYDQPDEIINIQTIQQALAHLEEYAEEIVCATVLHGVNSGEFVLSFNSEEDLWEVRGNYQTLLSITREGEIWESDELIRI